MERKETRDAKTPSLFIFLHSLHIVPTLIRFLHIAVFFTDFSPARVPPTDTARHTDVPWTGQWAGHPANTSNAPRDTVIPAVSHISTPHTGSVDRVGVLACIIAVALAAQCRRNPGRGIDACALRVRNTANTRSTLIQTAGCCGAGVLSYGCAEHAKWEAFPATPKQGRWCECTNGGVGV